jgi:hypothetical protein
LILFIAGFVFWSFLSKEFDVLLSVVVRLVDSILVLFGGFDIGLFKRPKILLLSLLLDEPDILNLVFGVELDLIGTDSALPGIDMTFL